jgi:SAM-dependent methyltransferase
VTRVPREAAIGFDRGALDYERGRPGYPPEAIDILAEALAIRPGARVVDLAAGTGKLTRVLRRIGADLVAVEPVAGMRAQLREAVPDVEVLDGTAEHLPLPDRSVDVVTVAQAFHWFDVPRAAGEIERVLVPGGGLAIVRNEWDDSVPWVGEMRRLVARRTGEPVRSHNRRWRLELEATGRFGPLSERTVANPVRVDLATLRSRVASLSFVAMLPDVNREQLLDEVAALVSRHGAAAGDGTIETPYVTHVVWTSTGSACARSPTRSATTG